MGWYEDAQQRDADEARARAVAAARARLAADIPSGWDRPLGPGVDLAQTEGQGLPTRMGPAPAFDPFAQVSSGPMQARVEPIGVESTLGPKPALAETEENIAGWGGLYGHVNRAKLQAARDEAEARARDTGMFPGGGPRKLTYAELMDGLTERTGGGSSSVSVTNAILSPKQAAAFASRIGEATESQKSAEAEKSSITQAMYRDLAAQNREQAAGQAAVFAAHESQRLKVQAQIDAQMADNAKMLQEVKAAHVDPDRMYKGEGGGFLRFRHTIGLALGALGAGLMKSTTNPVTQIVNGQLERDMQAQVANLGNKKWVYQAGRNMLTDLYAKTHDLEKAYTMGKMAYTDIARAMTEAITRDAQSAEAKENGAITIAQLDKQQVQNEMDLKKLEYRRVTRTSTSSPGTLTPAANLAMQAILAQRLQAAGVGGPASAGKIVPAGKTSESGEMIAGYKNTVTRLNAAEKEGSGWPEYLMGKVSKHVAGTDAERYESWRKSEALGLSRILNGGRPTDIDTVRVEGMFPQYGEPNFQVKSLLLKTYTAARIRGNIRALANGGYDARGLIQQAREAGINIDGPAISPDPASAIFKMPGLKKLGVK